MLFALLVRELGGLGHSLVVEFDRDELWVHVVGVGVEGLGLSDDLREELLGVGE